MDSLPVTMTVLTFIKFCFSRSHAVMSIAQMIQQI